MARVGDFNQLGENKQDDDSISVIARARNHLKSSCLTFDMDVGAQLAPVPALGKPIPFPRFPRNSQVDSRFIPTH